MIDVCYIFKSCFNSGVAKMSIYGIIDKF